jgi:hypothetical protein
MLPLIISKDLRHLRWWILIAAVGSTLPILPLWMNTAPMGMRFTISVFAGLASAILAILALQHLIHDDPLAGTQSFLATKPISRQRLLGNKILFAFVFFVLPGACLRVILYFSIWFDLPPAAYAIVLAQETLFGATLLAFFLLPAAWTTNFPRLIIVTVIGAIVLIAALAILEKIKPSNSPHISNNPAAIALLAALLQVTIIFGFCIAAAIYAGFRRISWSVGAVVLTLIATAMTAQHVRFPSPSPPLPAFRSPRIPLELDIVKGVPHNQQGSTSNKRVYKAVIFANLKNLPPTYCALATRVETTITGSPAIANGHAVLTATRSPISPDGETAAAKELLNMPLTNDDTRSHPGITLFESSQPLPDLARCMLQGEIQFTIYQAQRIATLPARKGGAARIAPYRFHIETVSSLGSRLEINLVVETLDSPLFARGETDPESTPFMAAISAPGTHEILLSDGHAQSSTSLGPYQIRTIRLIFKMKDDAAIPEELLKNGNLEIVSTPAVGTVSLPYSIKPAELRKP